jgi:hypothetical protein
MNKTTIAIFVSFVWIVLGVCLICFRFESVKEMPLNSIGDFLAGFFSPLAFLWLVFGYFQQGEELKLNTKALELQVHELRLSVEQQQELVAVTRADMTLSKQAYEREVEQATRQAQPVFRLQANGYSGGPSGTVHLQSSITNNGHTATKIQLDSNYGQVSTKEFAVLARDERREFQFSFPMPQVNEVKLRIHFTDGQGTFRHHVASLTKNANDGRISYLPSEEVFLTDV